MEHIAMRAEPRPPHLTKGQRKQLRAGGHILASVYGRDMDPMAVTVEAKDLRRALSAETGANTLIDLDVAGHKCLVRITDVETDPITHLPLHVGLHTIKAGEAQKASVTIELMGEPDAIRTHNGLLEPGATTVDVRALPERMVASLPLDISGMQMGDVLRAKDLTLPQGFELITDPEMPLVSLRTGHAVVLEEVLTQEAAIGPTDNETTRGTTEAAE